jgi:hypothetical protein
LAQKLCGSTPQNVLASLHDLCITTSIRAATAAQSLNVRIRLDLHGQRIKFGTTRCFVLPIITDFWKPDPQRTPHFPAATALALSQKWVFFD